MNDFKIEYLINLANDVADKIQQGHVADEAAQGIICNYKKFSLVVKNNENNIVGALTAYTAFAEVYVDDIWVDPNYRKLGIGRSLLLELENHFDNKGYNNINLVTSHFQAPEFYKKCGFEVEFIRQNKFNPQLTKIFFIKYFNNTYQNQGILKEIS